MLFANTRQMVACATLSAGLFWAAIELREYRSEQRSSNDMEPNRIADVLPRGKHLRRLLTPDVAGDQPAMLDPDVRQAAAHLPPSLFVATAGDAPTAPRR